MSFRFSESFERKCFWFNNQGAISHNLTTFQLAIIKKRFSTDGRKATSAPFHYSLLLITCQKSTRGLSEK